MTPSTLYLAKQPGLPAQIRLQLKPQHGICHFFRTKPSLGFRRGTPILPLKPGRPVSQDSLRALLAWEDLGGRIDRLSCRTRTLTFPRLMSLGGFGSRSRNFRLWLIAGLLFENVGNGALATGSTARISSGSSSGSGVFLGNFGFAGGFRSSSLMICGESPEDSGSSTGI